MVKTFSLPSIQWFQNQVVLQRALVNVFAPADYDLLQIAHPRTANRCINEASEKENSFGHCSSVTTGKNCFLCCFVWKRQFICCVLGEEPLPQTHESVGTQEHRCEQKEYSINSVLKYIIHKNDAHTEEI